MAKNGNGEGTIFKRSDGKWSGEVSYRDPATGKKKRKTFYGKLRKEVHEKMEAFKSVLKKAEAEGLQNSSPLNGGMLLKEWGEKWLNTYNTTIADSTFDDYELHLIRHIIPALGEIPLNQLKPIEIQEFFNSKKTGGRVDGKKGGLSTRSIRYIYIVLNACLEQAKNNKLIEENPIKSTKIDTVRNKEVIVFTEEEQVRFLQALEGDRMYAIFAFALFTGCRISEILPLSFRDLSFSNREVDINKAVSVSKNRNKDSENKKATKTQVGKTKTYESARIIPICEALYNILIEHTNRLNIEIKEKEE